MPTDFIYWPDTEHPSLEGEAAGIRSLLEQDGWAIQRAVASRPLFANLTALADESDEADFTEPAFRVETMNVQRAVGPAPYVGRPFSYMWGVAMGEGNRWVAGPAEIHHHPPSWHYNEEQT